MRTSWVCCHLLQLQCCTLGLERRSLRLTCQSLGPEPFLLLLSLPEAGHGVLLQVRCRPRPPAPTLPPSPPLPPPPAAVQVTVADYSAQACIRCEFLDPVAASLKLKLHANISRMDFSTRGCVFLRGRRRLPPAAAAAAAAAGSAARSGELWRALASPGGRWRASAREISGCCLGTSRSAAVFAARAAPWGCPRRRAGAPRMRARAHLDARVRLRAPVAVAVAMARARPPPGAPARTTLRALCSSVA